MSILIYPWESEEAAYSVNLDLKSFYNRMPDYRLLNLYVEVKFDADYSGNTMEFRVNWGVYNE